MGTQTRVHATSVALGQNGVLISGAAGSGKSSLALQLMAFGAQLITDDQTELTVRDSHLWASAPDSIRGLIEARGVGLLRAESVLARIVLAVDMDRIELDRLPALHEVSYLGCTLPCLHKVESQAWPAAILQYLKGGRREP
jgi:HPr kinase/phosphorylase